ncbi:hypothetical protein NDU88_001650 [Pleurodeles waltl]|uniref:Uncharacterized protein n=1 Tax=Pleurodeles waltl TaxID=8319 RepID=A0AAV7SDG6_PLEWA|nr:hypothetical protein NDU88_001650 [Pleurodeles waltl]
MGLRCALRSKRKPLGAERGRDPIRGALRCIERKEKGFQPKIPKRAEFPKASSPGLRRSELPASAVANRLWIQRQATGIHSVQAPDDSELKGDIQIASAFRDFYTKLYAGQTLPLEGPAFYLHDAHALRLTPDQAAALDCPIRIEEFAYAIARQKPLKSPGVDDFPALI